MKTLQLLTVTLLLCLHLSPGVVASVIPSTFPDQDPAHYTVRYISDESGRDTDSCLTNQPYPGNTSSMVVNCRNLQFALTESNNTAIVKNKSNLIVFLQPGSYTFGNKGIELYFFQNLVLAKEPDGIGEVVVSCDSLDEFSYNNLFIVNSTNIAIQGISFTQCGSLSPAVRTDYSRNIVVTQCVFRNNVNSGVLSYQTDGMTLTDCTFQDNNSTAIYNETDTLNPGEFHFAGGLSITWEDKAYSSPGTTAALIQNCTFIKNHAYIHMQNINDTRPNLYRPRGHGGGLGIFFDRTVNYSVMIEGTVFQSNTAMFNGGGIFISLFNNSLSNTITINGGMFEMNTCNSAGGGISVNTFEGSDNNIVLLNNCHFEQNSAWVGGGAMSLNLQDHLVAKGKNFRSNVAVFTNCTFTSNASPTGGSAVSLIANTRVDQVVARTTFINCSFLSNMGNMDQSAILSFRFPIHLQGNNVFKGNMGGGVLLLQSTMHMEGSVWFEGNNATEGGAVALQDQSLLHLYQDVDITFIENHAETRGGAISIETPTISLDTDIIRLFNTRCFVQYEVGTVPLSTNPALWNISMVFMNNTAGRDGAAIFATDISSCTYTPTFNSSKEDSLNYVDSIFRLSPQFHFSGNRVLNPVRSRTVEEVATEPTRLIVDPLTISATPGETIEFEINAVDESGNWQEAVWSISDHNSDEPQHNDTADEDDLENIFSLPSGGSKHPYTLRSINDTLYYQGCDNGLSRTLNLSLLQVLSGAVNSVAEVHINMNCCYPGYKFDKEDGICKHDHSSSPVLVRPDKNHRYIFIKPEHYAEVRDGGLISAVMPPSFQHCERSGSLTDACLFKFDSAHEQCSLNRTGFLCGKCPEGRGVDLTLRQCKKCTTGDAIIVAFIVIVFIVTSVLVLIFNIGIPNELKGCLFFVQVVGFVHHSSQTDAITWDFHLSRVFGFSLYLPVCPYPGYNALYTSAYGLLLPLLSIVTLTLYIISARFIRPLSQRSSFEGIWLLSIITYKYTADTCFNILRCQKVTGVKGEYVYYYDGTIRCFESATHIWFALFALLLGVVVVILFPLVILLISYKRFKMTQPFTDVLNRGIKTSCRWWSSFDLFRRLLFVLVVLLFNYISPAYIQVALLFAGLFVFFVFALLKPYESLKTNIIEAAVLLDLLVLTALFLDTDSRNLSAVHPYALTLLLLPFISIILYITLILFKRIWKRVSPTSFTTCFMSFKDFIHGKTLLKQHSVVSHDLEVKQEQDGYADLQTDLTDSNEEMAEFQSDYSAYREELIEEDN